MIAFSMALILFMSTNAGGLLVTKAVMASWSTVTKEYGYIFFRYEDGVVSTNDYPVSCNEIVTTMEELFCQPVSYNSVVTQFDFAYWYSGFEKIPFSLCTNSVSDNTYAIATIDGETNYKMKVCDYQLQYEVWGGSVSQNYMPPFSVSENCMPLFYSVSNNSLGIESTESNPWTDKTSITVRTGTKGYEDVAFSTRLWGTKDDIDYFELKYSLDGVQFKTVDNSKKYLEEDKKSTELYSSFPLPKECEDCEDIYVRMSIVPKSRTGAVGLDTISIEGKYMRHRLSYTEGNSADCTHDGNIGYWYCSICKKYFADARGKAAISKEMTKLPMLNHPKTEVRNQKNATKSNEGYTGDTYCLDCGKLVKKGVTIPRVELPAEEKACAAGNHAWDSGVIIQNPTCKTEGTSKYTCTRTGCGATKLKSIAKTNIHLSKEIRNAKVASKDEEGYTGDEYCVDCGAKLSEGTVIEKLSAPVAVGESVADEKTKGTYEITATDEQKKEVKYEAPANKKDKKITVPDTVEIDGEIYKVTKIEKGAFKKNTSVTKVTIGSNIKEIGKDAFNGATKLTTVTVGKNVTTIGNNAFKGCKSLKSIAIDKKVTKIGSNAFNGCKKLKTLTIKSTKLNDKNVSKNAFKGITKGTTVKVPKNKVKAYKKLFKKKGLSTKVKLKAI